MTLCLVCLPGGQRYGHHLHALAGGELGSIRSGFARGCRLTGSCGFERLHSVVLAFLFFTYVGHPRPSVDISKTGLRKIKSSQPIFEGGSKDHKNRPHMTVVNLWRPP